MSDYSDERHPERPVEIDLLAEISEDPDDLDSDYGRGFAAGGRHAEVLADELIHAHALLAAQRPVLDAVLAWLADDPLRKDRDLIVVIKAYVASKAVPLS